MQNQLMQKIAARYVKSNVPILKPGDTVRVHQRIKEGSKERIQVFEGVVIALHAGLGLDATFSVRKVSYGIGVERVFPLHSPRIVKVERTKTADVRRAKLYYLRDRTGRSARLDNERADVAVWEEPTAAPTSEIDSSDDQDAAEDAVLAEETEAAQLNADDSAASNPVDDARAEENPDEDPAPDEASPNQEAAEADADQTETVQAEDMPTIAEGDTPGDVAEATAAEDDGDEQSKDDGLPLEPPDSK